MNHILQITKKQKRNYYQIHFYRKCKLHIKYINLTNDKKISINKCYNETALFLAITDELDSLSKPSTAGHDQYKNSLINID